MHKIYKRTTAIFLTSLLIFISGCGNERTEEINPAFIGFISGFTSGMVSNETTIKINLVEPAQNVQYDEPIDDDLFDFSPNIYWSWF